jgi:hypothetical protein
MKPGLLIAVPNQSDFMRVDRWRMSTAIIPGAISVETVSWLVMPCNKLSSSHGLQGVEFMAAVNPAGADVRRVSWTD